MSSKPACLVIGASHAGVTFAFALRQEGWTGSITLFDADPALPYQRPPLSKGFLAGEDPIEAYPLQAAAGYAQEGITLRRGVRVTAIDRAGKRITLAGGETVAYDTLVLATGARPLIPPIPGLAMAPRAFPLRTAADVLAIREALRTVEAPRVVVIGGGYIGLETAASLAKTGARVTILEREDRLLARVTAPVVSKFYRRLHEERGIEVHLAKEVSSVVTDANGQTVHCAGGERFLADVIVVGTGIRVNTELAATAGLVVNNGIHVDATTRTADPAIYAIGDCTFHHNPLYDRKVRLESVQNAVDQAKVAAAAVAGHPATYAAIPWFWSDQYDVKLQTVGLAAGYTDTVVRREAGDGPKFSVWYFRGERLLAVDAINNAKAYVIGTRFLKSGQQVDKAKLADPDTPLKPAELERSG